MCVVLSMYHLWTHSSVCGAKNSLRPLTLPKHKGVSYIIPRKRYTNLTLAIPSFLHQHSWIQMQTNMRLQYLLSQHTLEPNGFYWKTPHCWCQVKTAPEEPLSNPTGVPAQPSAPVRAAESCTARPYLEHRGAGPTLLECANQFRASLKPSDTKTKNNLYNRYESFILLDLDPKRLV